MIPNLSLTGRNVPGEMLSESNSIPLPPKVSLAASCVFRENAFSCPGVIFSVNRGICSSFIFFRFFWRNRGARFCKLFCEAFLFGNP